MPSVGCIVMLTYTKEAKNLLNQLRIQTDSSKIRWVNGLDELMLTILALKFKLKQKRIATLVL